MRARLLRARRLAPAAGVCLLALVVRLLQWRRVFLDGQVVFPGNDAYYHARRVLYTSAHFPSLLERDPYLNFPHAGEPIWAPLLDLAAAMAVRVLGVADEPEAVLALIPPLLGAATVGLVYAAARAHLGPAPAIVAGVILAVLPAHSNYSRVGFFDHHVAVALVTAALLWVTLAWRRRAGEQDAKPRGNASLTAATGALLGGALLVWPGMLLQVALTIAVLGVTLISQTERAGASRQAWMLVASLIGAALIVAPASLGHSWVLWGSFTPVVLTSFQPWFFGSCALAFATYAVTCSGTVPLGVRDRGLRVLAGAAAALALSVFWLPELADGLADAARWFGRQETFQSEVAESRPLLFRGGRLELGEPSRALTPVIFLLPALAWWVLRSATTATEFRARVVVVAWSGVLTAAALAQARFANSLSVPWSVLLGLALVLAWRRFRSRPRSGWRSALAGVGLLVASVLAIAPVATAHGAYLKDQLAWLVDGSPDFDPRQQRKLMLLDLARWLRTRTEPTSGFLDADARPEYGILSSWTDGHVIVYEGRRPAVVSNFGDDVGEENMLLSEEFFRSGEQRASEILDQLRARYVIVEFRRTRSLSVLGPDSVLLRLFFRDGEERETAIQLSHGKIETLKQPSEAIDRLRLVYESRPKSWAPVERAGFKVFEHVAGAEFRGRAEAGARVEARLGVQTERGRSFEFVSSTTADPRGRFALRFPYATGTAGPGVSTDDHVLLSSGGQIRRIRIEEEDVLLGGTIEAPSLAPDATTGSF